MKVLEDNALRWEVTCEDCRSRLEISYADLDETDWSPERYEFRCPCCGRINQWSEKEYE